MEENLARPVMEPSTSRPPLADWFNLMTIVSELFGNLWIKGAFHCRCSAARGANRRMTLDDMIAQRDALLAARFRGVRTSQRSTLSSTISARNLPCSAIMRPTVMGRRKRRGPALPGLKKSMPFFVSILGWCE